MVYGEKGKKFYSERMGVKAVGNVGEAEDQGDADGGAEVGNRGMRHGKIVMWKEGSGVNWC